MIFQFRKKKRSKRKHIELNRGYPWGRGGVAATWWHKTLIGWEKSCMHQSDMHNAFTSHMS